MSGYNIDYYESFFFGRGHIFEFVRNKIIFDSFLDIFCFLYYRLMVKFVFTGRELLKLSLHVAEATLMRMVMSHQ